MSRLVKIVNNKYVQIEEYKNPNICFNTNEYNDLEDYCTLRETFDPFEMFYENQELKKQLEKKYSKIGTLTNEVLYQENQELKKQLEDANEQISYLRRSIERKEERIIDLQYERIPYTNEYVDKLLNQQKEFIEYMNKTIEDCNNYSKYIEKKTKKLHGRSCGKTYIANEIMKNEIAKKILKEILQKYKSIIGESNEKES